jgi:polysaccharide biosynthesis/export protein
MKKIILFVSILLPSLLIGQANPSTFGALDNDYLESLPESVRQDLQDEITKNKEENTNSFKKRPSSELLKYDLIKDWEEFQRTKNEELVKSERYGLNLFRTMQSSFMPVNEPNFGNNYMLDYGDIIEVSLYGNNSFEYELEIKRDGTITIPELGSMLIAGLNYQQGVEKLQQKIKTSYTGTEAIINLKELRDIKVLVTGNVEFPGIYTLSGNSNVLQALNMAGGVNENGTLRDVQIKREGKIIKNIDLYKPLLFGELSDLDQLQSGDAIYVKSASNLIRAGNGFINEALFEMKDNENLEDLFIFSGGKKRSVVSNSFSLVGRDGSIINNLTPDNTDYKLKHLDSIYFNSTNIGTIKISGEVERPGSYSINPGDDIFDIINRAGGYTDQAYSFASVLKRKTVKDLEAEYIKKSYNTLITFLAQNPDRLQSNSGIGAILEEFKNLTPSGRVITEFDMQVLKDNPSSRTMLMNQDEIQIPMQSNTVYVYGEVGNPQALSFTDMLPIKDYISMAGGMNKIADRSRIIVVQPNGEASIVNLTKFPNLKRQEVDIYPGSLIYVPQQIVTTQNIQFYSAIAPIFSSLALSLASLNSIK